MKRTNSTICLNNNIFIRTYLIALNIIMIKKKVGKHCKSIERNTAFQTLAASMGKMSIIPGTNSLVD